VPDKPPISKVFNQLGLTKSLQKIKFGGVVGKQTIMVMVSVVALASIAWRMDATGGLIIASLCAGLVALVAVLNFCYAHKHPAEATLEGAEMIALQHQMLAAKSMEAPKNSPMIPNPGGAPPQLNPPQEAEE